MSLRKIQSLSVLLAISAGLFLTASLLNSDLKQLVGLVVLWAAAEGVISWAGLWWATDRSPATFMALFLGGTFVRLLGLCAVAVFCIQFGFPLAAPMLALVFSYVVLSLVQVPFFGARA